MADKPIPFSAPMVRAILAGTKAQTRRPLRAGTWWTAEHGVIRMAPAGLACTGFAYVACPYGQAGDRLWVREAWRTESHFDHLPPRDLDPSMRATPVQYEAGPHADVIDGKLRPGMFMPRWASRILLEVVGVRVERLQDISAADAMAEGVWTASRDMLEAGRRGVQLNHIGAYRNLWEQINGPGSWDANPFVWVIEFKRAGADWREG